MFDLSKVGKLALWIFGACFTFGSLAFALSALDMGSLSPNGVVAFSFLMKLAGFCVAATVIWAVLRGLDKYNDDAFGPVRKKINADPKAAAIYRGLRFFSMCLLAGLLLGCSVANAASLQSSRYDETIQDAVDIYWADYPFWKMWKAQIYQESLLEPSAVSPVGARGLAQFMPDTWQQVAHELGYEHLNPHMVEPAIMAGAYYMLKLRRGWSSPRPAADRQKLAQASYNAGFGNLLKAQRRCNGAILYDDIIDCLPSITGRHSRETITYVKRIKRWYLILETSS